MRRPVSLLATLLALSTTLYGQATAPSRIRIGDELTVYVYGEKELSGSFTVQTDGAIYVPRAGRLVVTGLTAQEAQGRLLVRLRSLLVSPTATISIAKQRGNAIYVVGGAEGVLPFGTETDLRQVYAAAQVKGDPDLTQITVFRNGRKIATMSATDLTSGRANAFNGPLQANDLVVFEPKPFIRVWVIGTVVKPGRVVLSEGDDVYRAIAQAGDVPPEPTSGPTRLRSDYVVTIRRGPETISVPLVFDPSRPPVRLESGDTVSVQPPTEVRVTFTGFVRSPGETVFKAGTSLATAIGARGGATVGASPDNEGSLKSVILFHDGIASFHDLSPRPGGPAEGDGPTLSDGDVVFVPRNERKLYVFGSVNRVGRVVMVDNRVYRLADALAESGGLAAGGSLTRVSVGRPGPDGKLLVKTYRLDKFIKDGDASQNPILQPNDVVYVDTTRGITFQSAVNAISAALLLDSLARR